MKLIVVNWIPEKSWYTEGKLTLPSICNNYIYSKDIISWKQLNKTKMFGIDFA